MAVTVTPANVRSLIDVSVTADNLPDATVNLQHYAGRAVLEVKGRDPEHATRSGDAATRLNIAADSLCAAYIVRKMPWLVGEDQGTAGGYRRQQTDVAALISELLASASEQIEEVVGEDADEKPTFFTLASGTRGL